MRAACPTRQPEPEQLFSASHQRIQLTVPVIRISAIVSSYCCTAIARASYRVFFVFLAFLFTPFIGFATFYSSFSLPRRSSDRGSPVSKGSSSPSPLRYVPSFLSREGFSPFLPRQLASNCAYPRRKALSAVQPLIL